jgi:hypothetical protein
MGEIHDLLEEKGKLAVRQLVEGRRGGRLVEAAAAYFSDETLGVGLHIQDGAKPVCPTVEVDGALADPPLLGQGSPDNTLAAAACARASALRAAASWRSASMTSG